MSEIEQRIADVLAHNRCRQNNPKADHPIWGYLTFSEDQREFLRGQQAQTVAELMPLIAEAQAEALRALFDDMDPSEMAPERVERYIKKIEEQR